MFVQCFIEIKNISNPNCVRSLRLENKVVDGWIQKGIQNYILVFIMIFFVVLLEVSFSIDDYMTAFTAVATTINNVGPGLGKVGPAQNFYTLTNLNKIILSMTMLVGRLEIFPVIILFSPNNWKRG